MAMVLMFVAGFLTCVYVLGLIIYYFYVVDNFAVYRHLKVLKSIDFNDISAYAVYQAYKERNKYIVGVIFYTLCVIAGAGLITFLVCKAISM